MRPVTAWLAKLLGSPPVGSEKYDAIGLALRGLLVTLPAGLDLAITGHGFAWAPAGVAMPAIYWVAWRVPSRNPAFAQTGLGEAAFGAWLGTVLAWGVG